MLRHNNWMSYSYDGEEYSIKKTPKSIFNVHFKKLSLLNLSYKDALFRNASIMKDTFSEPFDVCLSGGIDSEVVVRVFKDLGINFNTYIFKFENNHNVRDVTNAINLCNALNIKYHIVDFNLKKFFKTEAAYYAEKTFSPATARLPRLKWIEMLDNIPVFGDGEPHWSRKQWDNFSKKSDWGFHFSEDGCLGSIYSRQIGKTAITEWYEYTPEVLLSFYKLPYIQKLLNDEIPGKLSTYSSRATIHQEIWPDIKYIQKLIGYENKNKKPGERPKFMTKLQNTLLGYTNMYNVISEEEFKEIFCNV